MGRDERHNSESEAYFKWKRRGASWEVECWAFLMLHSSVVYLLHEKRFQRRRPDV